MLYVGMMLSVLHMAKGYAEQVKKAQHRKKQVIYVRVVSN